VPFTFFEDKKFNIALASDPRFIVLSSKIKDSKFPPTYVPLSNVSYFHLKDLPKDEEDKPSVVDSVVAAVKGKKEKK
jgi:hypothetical protein